MTRGKVVWTMRERSREGLTSSPVTKLTYAGLVPRWRVSCTTARTLSQPSNAQSPA